MKFQRLFAFTTLAIVLGGASSAFAGIVQYYNLTGSSQPGLHYLNEPSVASGGTGGEIGAGIFLDDGNDADPNTNLLTISNVGWGSSQGFTDMTSTVTASHIHGPTTGNNGGGGFTQTAGVLFNLTRSSSAVTGGVFTNAPIAITAAQQFDLNNGKWYINIHTSTNGGGEIRGFIVPAPEPGSIGLILVGGACALFRRRR